MANYGRRSTRMKVFSAEARISPIISLYLHFFSFILSYTKIIITINYIIFKMYNCDILTSKINKLWRIWTQIKQTKNTVFDG